MCSFFSAYLPETLCFMNHESWIMNHEPWIMIHESRTMNHESWITNHESWIMNHKPWITIHESWAHQAVTLTRVTFGTQSYSKFQHFTFGPKTGWRDTLVENSKLNPNNHYSWKPVVFVTQSLYVGNLYCTKWVQWKPVENLVLSKLFMQKPTLFYANISVCIKKK